MLPPIARRETARAGFTLAEAAVTLAMVALVLTYTMQSMQASKLAALQTLFRKTAAEMGNQLLGQVASGRWQDEIQDGGTLTGTFADQDEPDIYWELALGDDEFAEIEPDPDGRSFDNLAYRQQWQEDNRDDDEDEEDTEHEPFEKVRLKIIHPQVRELPNELVLERWIPWEQVYGPDEEEEATEEGAGTNGGGGEDQTQ